MREKLVEGYGFIFEDGLIEDIIKSGKLVKVNAGDKLIEFGDPIVHMPLLLNGAIKIMREDENGDELLLYFLEIGDTCAMTLSCCMGEQKSEIRAIAEKEGEIIMIPVGKMAEWLNSYKSWRSFVFESYNIRIKELLESIDSLAFMNLHDRTYKYLKDKVLVNKTTDINITHKEIADDLNTSRVVISRILKQLEKEAKIALSRNAIEILKF